MIAALHAAGIGVIMGVVYNHMYRSEEPAEQHGALLFLRQNPDFAFRGVGGVAALGSVVVVGSHASGLAAV